MRDSQQAPAAAPVVDDPRHGIAALKRRLGVSGTTIGRWVRAGIFPAPHYVGEKRAWFESEIRRFEIDRMTRPPEARSNVRNLAAKAGR